MKDLISLLAPLSKELRSEYTELRSDNLSGGVLSLVQRINYVHDLNESYPNTIIVPRLFPPDIEITEADIYESTDTRVANAITDGRELDLLHLRSNLYRDYVTNNRARFFEREYDPDNNSCGRCGFTIVSPTYREIHTSLTICSLCVMESSMIRRMIEESELSFERHYPHPVTFDSVFMLPNTEQQSIPVSLEQEQPFLIDPSITTNQVHREYLVGIPNSLTPYYVSYPASIYFRGELFLAFIPSAISEPERPRTIADLYQDGLINTRWKSFLFEAAVKAHDFVNSR